MVRLVGIWGEIRPISDWNATGGGQGCIVRWLIGVVIALHVSERTRGLVLALGVERNSMTDRFEYYSLILFSKQNMAVKVAMSPEPVTF